MNVSGIALPSQAFTDKLIFDAHNCAAPKSSVCRFGTAGLRGEVIKSGVNLVRNCAKTVILPDREAA